MHNRNKGCICRPFSSERGGGAGLYCTKFLREDHVFENQNGTFDTFLTDCFGCGPKKTLKTSFAPIFVPFRR
jgi:hypothetical protein